LVWEVGGKTIKICPDCTSNCLDFQENSCFEKGKAQCGSTGISLQLYSDTSCTVPAGSPIVESFGCTTTAKCSYTTTIMTDNTCSVSRGFVTYTGVCTNPKCILLNDGTSYQFVGCSMTPTVMTTIQFYSDSACQVQSSTSQVSCNECFSPHVNQTACCTNNQTHSQEISCSGAADTYALSITIHLLIVIILTLFY